MRKSAEEKDASSGGRCPVCKSPDVPATVKQPGGAYFCGSCDRGVKSNDRGYRAWLIAHDLLRANGAPQSPFDTPAKSWHGDVPSWRKAGAELWTACIARSHGHAGRACEEVNCTLKGLIDVSPRTEGGARLDDEGAAA